MDTNSTLNSDTTEKWYAAFQGVERVGFGTLSQVALKAKDAYVRDPSTPVQVYDDQGEFVELDLRGTNDELLARLPQTVKPDPEIVPDETPAGPGRPRLGVVAREITLLPRHWDWLATQPGGASVAIRKLVEEARKASVSADKIRHTRETTYRFMSSVAGNLPGFEDATRALFGGDKHHFRVKTNEWPVDIRDHVRYMAAEAFEEN